MGDAYERLWSLARILGAVGAPPFVRDEAELAFAGVPEVWIVRGRTRDPGEVSKACITGVFQRFVSDLA